MIGCGIDKYGTKNMVAKMGKAFGLEDGQVSDLLKFIETGYDKYEKSKKWNGWCRIFDCYFENVLLSCFEIWLILLWKE